MHAPVAVCSGQSPSLVHAIAAMPALDKAAAVGEAKRKLQDVSKALKAERRRMNRAQRSQSDCSEHDLRVALVMAALRGGNSVADSLRYSCGYRFVADFHADF